MFALILAAGRGSRLGELTRAQPKCLTRLAGKPLLEWQLAALAAAGIDRIAVVRGYAGHCLDDRRFTTIDNPRWQQTNMVASLGCAADHLRREPCLVLYSDIVYHPRIITAIAAADGELAIAYDRLWRTLWQARFADPLGDAETFGEHDGWLTEIGGRAASLDAIAGQYMGVLRFTPAAWARVEDHLARLGADAADRLDMTGLLARRLAAGERIRCVPVAGGWCEVDSAADLEVYEAALRAGGWPHDWRWADDERP